MTAPEARLWISLKGHRAAGLKFRRQHPPGPYVLDFYCDSAKLAVEIDGFVHATDDHPQRDAARDAWLAARGVRTLRIDVRDDPDAVVATVVAWAQAS